jgi:hypothetical protein
MISTSVVSVKVILTSTDHHTTRRLLLRPHAVPFLQNAAQQHVIADMMPTSVAAKAAQQRPSSSLNLTPSQGDSVAAVAGVVDECGQLAASALNLQERPKLRDHELLLLHRDEQQQQQQQQQRSASASRHSSCVRILRVLAAVDHVSLLLIRCLEVDTLAVTSAVVAASSSAAAAAAASAPAPSSSQQPASDACGRISSSLSLLFDRLKLIKCDTSRNRSN